MTTTITPLYHGDDLSLAAAFNHPVLTKYADTEDDRTIAADAASGELIEELDMEPAKQTEFKSLVLAIFAATDNTDRALDALWQTVEAVSANA